MKYLSRRFLLALSAGLFGSFQTIYPASPELSFRLAALALAGLAVISFLLSETFVDRSRTKIDEHKAAGEARIAELKAREGKS